MPRYFFHLHGSGATDSEGQEFPDDEAARRAIAAEYAREVQRLIETGNWAEAPAFEDQLPDDWMPEAFFAYWGPDSPP